MIRVLVADNRPLFHSAYYAAFAETADITVIDTISDEKQLRPYCQQEQPNVIFISQGMYNLLPSDFFADLQADHSSSYCLILLADKDSFCLERVNENGISGCLLENETDPQLTQAVKTVVQGKPWFSPSLIPHLLQPQTKNTLDLTEQEYKVLQLVVVEQTNKEIAQTLYIAERTVSHHLSCIYAKLGVKTRVGTAVQAMKLKLFNEQDSTLDQ